MNVKELLDVLAPETYVQICNSGVYCCSELPYRKIKSLLDCEVFGIDICNGVLRVSVSAVNSVSTTVSINCGTIDSDSSVRG